MKLSKRLSAPSSLISEMLVTISQESDFIMGAPKKSVAYESNPDAFAWVCARRMVCRALQTAQIQGLCVQVQNGQSLFVSAG